MQERRQYLRRWQYHPREVQIRYQDDHGQKRVVTARLADISDGGLGVETDVPLAVGSVVSVSGELRSGDSQIPIQSLARVAFSLRREGGAYRFGLSFKDPDDRSSSQDERRQEPENAGPDSFLDYYEILQVSPNADPEILHRVYRLLAQRFHPDNREKGNEEAFKLVLKAYRVLSDPQQRAAYDMKHRAFRKPRRKIFGQQNSGCGLETERRKRRGILRPEGIGEQPCYGGSNRDG